MSQQGKPSLTLAQLRAFRAVARTGSFSGAAAELDVSQAAVSQALASLEGILQKRLLSRERGTINLTRAGEDVLECANQALGAVDTLVERVAAVRHLGGLVKVAAFRSAAAHIVSPLAARMRTRMPGVEIALFDQGGDYQRVLDAVLSGEMEIAVSALPGGPELVRAKIGSDEFVLVAPKGRVQKRGSDPWAEPDALLSRFRLLVPDQGHGSHHCAVESQRYWQGKHRSVRIIATMQDESVVLAMVENGLGVAFLPRLAVEPLSKQLRVVHTPGPLTRDIYVVARRQALDRPSVHAVYDALTDSSVLAQLPATAQQAFRVSEPIEEDNTLVAISGTGAA